MSPAPGQPGARGKPPAVIPAAGLGSGAALVCRCESGGSAAACAQPDLPLLTEAVTGLATRLGPRA